MKSVLIAHSNVESQQILENALILRGCTVSRISDGMRALEMINKNQINDLFAELDLPQVSGLELLIHMKQQNPESRVVLISGDPSAKAAADAFRAGACDYLAEPFDSEEADACVDRLYNDGFETENEIISTGRYDNIIGESPAIRNVFKLVDKVAASDSTVMIYGESGTGKELIARAIHHTSHRRNQPMVPVNCGAIPEELLESELFGHEKGAFTSAIRTRIGRFEMSNEGTIFLDEIADMSPKLQVKVLRVLQEHKIERIGGAKTIDVNIRVITATNKDLRKAMEKGSFREDLFYRLNVIPITIPPLRERKDDIPLLTDYFIKRFQDTRASLVTGIAPAAQQKLLDYQWPGNIRELENIIERMVILAENDVLTLEDLPPRIADSKPTARSNTIEITNEGIDFNKVVSDFEDQLLIQALEKAGWVKNKAAQLLKLNRTTLVEKLKKKGIGAPSK